MSDRVSSARKKRLRRIAVRRVVIFRPSGLRA